MLKEEQGAGVEKRNPEPLTYSAYMRVPELLDLQSPLSSPLVHDEMLFIIVQQIQELWFKQALHELHAIIGLLGPGEPALSIAKGRPGQTLEAVRLLTRMNRIIKAMGDEVTILETMPPQEFHRFRHVLSSSSGFESEQFREL